MQDLKLVFSVSWIKENLRDIMDDIEAEYNAEMEKNE